MRAEDLIKAATQFTFGPRDADDDSRLIVTAEWRGGDAWAVLHGPWCLSHNGNWDWEMQPSSRTDEWLSAHRFDRDRAVELAATKAAIFMQKRDRERAWAAPDTASATDTRPTEPPR